MTTKLCEPADELATARYLPLRAASVYCGLSTSTLRRMTEAGKLTAFRPIAGRVLLDRGELDKMIRATAS